MTVHGIWLIPLVLGFISPPNAGRSSTVGIPARFDQLVLPGPELEVVPIDEVKSPIVLRIAEVYPHGNGFRYDLVFYGLEPGGYYDLRNYLRRKDGTKTDGLPTIPVEITSVLPPGQVEPNRLEIRRTSWFAGYRPLLLTGAMLWSAGLVWILYVMRRKTLAENASQVDRPLTLADRLRPLVEGAVDGTLSPARYAELERLLIGYWRARTGLDHADPAVAIKALRDHEEAGPVVRLLEEWLHKPGGAGSVDVAALLRPYQDIPANEPEPAGAR